MLLLPLLLLAQKPDVRALEARVKTALEASLKDSKGFVGMTAAFVLPDGSRGEIALGKADRESGKPMKPRDRILAGSVGKTFFAALALMLVEEGKLELDAPVSRYLKGKPYFERIPNASSLTVRHLMNHTSGIPEHVESEDVVAALKKSPDKTWEPGDIVAFLLDKKPLFEPGKGWSYADANYIVLGLVLDRILYLAEEQTHPRGLVLEEGQCYRNILKRFVDPLDLDDTMPSVHRRMPGLVQGYSMPNSPFFPSGPVMADGKLPINPSFEWGGGGYVSNSRDLAWWAWNLWGGRALKPTSLAEMLKGVAARTGPQDQYGLGAMLIPTSVGISHGHEGWWPGYLSQTMYLPDHKIAIAVQFNTDDMRALGHRTRWFCDLVAKTLVSGQ